MRRITARLAVAALLAAGLAQAGHGTVARVAAAGPDACAGTGPEPPFWPAPVGASGATWVLNIPGTVRCDSTGAAPVSFTLVLSCNLSEVSLFSRSRFTPVTGAAVRSLT